MCMDQVIFTVCNHVGKVRHKNEKCRARGCLAPIAYMMTGTLPDPCSSQWWDAHAALRPVEGWCSSACRRLYGHLPHSRFHGATPEQYVRERAAREALEARDRARDADPARFLANCTRASRPSDRRFNDPETMVARPAREELARRARPGAVRTAEGDALLDKVLWLDGADDTGSRGGGGGSKVLPLYAYGREDDGDAPMDPRTARELARKAREDRERGNRTGSQHREAVKAEERQDRRERKARERRAARVEERENSVLRGRPPEREQARHHQQQLPQQRNLGRDLTKRPASNSPPAPEPKRPAPVVLATDNVPRRPLPLREQAQRRAAPNTVVPTSATRPRRNLDNVFRGERLSPAMSAPTPTHHQPTTTLPRRAVSDTAAEKQARMLARKNSSAQESTSRGSGRRRGSKTNSLPIRHLHIEEMQGGRRPHQERMLGGDPEPTAANKLLLSCRRKMPKLLVDTGHAATGVSVSGPKKKTTTTVAAATTTGSLAEKLRDPVAYLKKVEVQLLRGGSRDSFACVDARAIERGEIPPSTVKMVEEHEYRQLRLRLQQAQERTAGAERVYRERM